MTAMHMAGVIIGLMAMLRRRSSMHRLQCRASVSFSRLSLFIIAKGIASCRLPLGDKRGRQAGSHEEHDPAEKLDVWLSAKVKAKLLFHRSASPFMEVNTKDGIMILHSNATSKAQKELTTEYAKDVEGVKT